MTYLVNNILCWIASIILAFTVKCYDGWYIKPYFEHPEIPFIAYLGIVVLFRIMVANFTAIEFNAAMTNELGLTRQVRPEIKEALGLTRQVRPEIKEDLIPATITLIFSYSITLFWGWVLHFFL